MPDANFRLVHAHTHVHAIHTCDVNMYVYTVNTTRTHEKKMWMNEEVSGWSREHWPRNGKDGLKGYGNAAMAEID